MNTKLRPTSLEEIMLNRQESIDPSQYQDEEFELFSIPAYDSQNPEISRGSEIGSAKKRVEPGDVLLSRIVPHIRRAWVVPESKGNRQIASGEWIVFRSKAFYSNYLRHYLMSDVFHAQFMNTVAGVGGSLLRARPAFVAEIKIPLPPLPEQKRIADILDKADAIRRKRREALSLLSKATSSLFFQEFGDPLFNPKGWEVKLLADVCHKITDGVHLKPNYTDSGVPFVSVKDITTGKLRFDDVKYVSEDDHAKHIKACHPEFGDVLLTKVGATYGRPALVDTERKFSLYVSVALIKPNHSLIDPVFLKEVLASNELKRQADRSIKGAGVPDLHLVEIRKFRIPLPPLHVQQSFVAKTKAIHALEEKLFDAENEKTCLFNSLSQQAFTSGV